MRLVEFHPNLPMSMAMNDIWLGGSFSEINLDSSITDVILLTNLIFLASKLGGPTLSHYK